MQSQLASLCLPLPWAVWYLSSKAPVTFVQSGLISLSDVWRDGAIRQAMSSVNGFRRRE